MKLMIIMNDVDVTLVICEPLSVPVPPPGNVTVTVNPLTNLCPFTVTF